MICTIVIKDEVNCKVEGLDLNTRKKCEKELKFFMPYAYHVPAYKLGRWDGCVSFFTVGGVTYVNLLDRILPIIMEAGYQITVDDKREAHQSFDFDAVDESTFATQSSGQKNIKWPVSLLRIT